MRGERLSSYAKQTFTSASCPSTVVEFGKGQHNAVSCLPPTTLSRIFLRGSRCYIKRTNGAKSMSTFEWGIMSSTLTNTSSIAVLMTLLSSRTFV